MGSLLSGFISVSYTHLYVYKRQTYGPWHDKTTGKTFLKFDQSKCLHYYFYIIDRELGLCYLRVPTCPPFRLQFYMNGHNLLAYKLDKKQMCIRDRILFIWIRNYMMNMHLISIVR